LDDNSKLLFLCVCWNTKTKIGLFTLNCTVNEWIAQHTFRVPKKKKEKRKKKNLNGHKVCRIVTLESRAKTKKQTLNQIR